MCESRGHDGQPRDNVASVGTAVYTVAYSRCEGMKLFFSGADEPMCLCINHGKSFDFQLSQDRKGFWTSCQLGSLIATCPPDMAWCQHWSDHSPVFLAAGLSQADLQEWDGKSEGEQAGGRSWWQPPQAVGCFPALSHSLLQLSACLESRTRPTHSLSFSPPHSVYRDVLYFGSEGYLQVDRAFSGLCGDGKIQVALVCWSGSEHCTFRSLDPPCSSGQKVVDTQQSKGPKLANALPCTEPARSVPLLLWDDTGRGEICSHLFPLLQLQVPRSTEPCMLAWRCQVWAREAWGKGGDFSSWLLWSLFR